MAKINIEFTRSDRLTTIDGFGVQLDERRIISLSEKLDAEGIKKARRQINRRLREQTKNGDSSGLALYKARKTNQ